jgi:pyridoxal/pyridoxine/pyridoxamine kinase
MGDNGALYVPPSFVSIYRDRLIPLADVITPNQTEAEQLSGIPIRDESSAIENIEWFHRRGVRTVIITSLTYPTATRADTATAAAAATTADPDAAAASTPAGVIHVLASTLEEGDSAAEPLRSRRVAHMQFHHVPMYFSGTGDLSSALLLAWIVRTHQQEQQQAQMNGGTSVPPSRLSFSTLVRALELCMATLQAVIRRTFAAGSEELLLIQSKADIETPVITQRATIIDIDPK